MLNRGLVNRGIIVVEGYDYELIDKIYLPHDNISALVTLHGNGTISKTIIASIAEAIAADVNNAPSWQRLKEIFRSPSLQMVTFSITEKGYALYTSKGEPTPGVDSDLAAGPAAPQSYMGKIAALLYERYIHGGTPLAMVSTDNCSHNGSRLADAIATFATAWTEAGVCEKGFAEYVADNEQVSFPWTMIDKITPRPDKRIEQLLADDGIEDIQPIVTSRDTYVAPFVNAEECQYLVVEDTFPNGRPPLDEVGPYFTDRATVDKVEKMKVCTCLNPLHTCLAVFGCLLGYKLIADEMNDPDLKRLVERVGYIEGLPVVTDPQILSPKKFIDEVVNSRIPNPFMPDTPQRIACDTSQKLPIRFGETIKAYTKRDDLKIADLQVIPLVFAGWLRYLMAIDDQGNHFSLSPDPLLADVCQYVEKLRIGSADPAAVEAAVAPLLHREEIFGVDLYEVQLAHKVVAYLSSMLQSHGAIRQTIKQIV